MSQKRVNVLSGQVFGKVDWVTQDRREIGMFLRTSERGNTRCVIRGSEVERLLANGLLHKGMMVTAHGEMAARCQKRHEDGTYYAEIVVLALRIVAESPTEGRVRGVLHANLKGVIMHWDPQTLLLKTFLNPTEPEVAPTVTCSIHVETWVNGMSPDGRARFLAMVKLGREYTASAVVEVSCYKNREGVQTPVILFLPTDLKLQS